MQQSQCSASVVSQVTRFQDVVTAPKSRHVVTYTITRLRACNWIRWCKEVYHSPSFSAGRTCTLLREKSNLKFIWALRKIWKRCRRNSYRPVKVPQRLESLYSRWFQEKQRVRRPKEWGIGLGGCLAYLSGLVTFVIAFRSSGPSIPLMWDRYNQWFWLSSHPVGK